MLQLSFSPAMAETPRQFNFARDVIDYWTRIRPGAPALFWADEASRSKTFSFAELSDLSRRAADLFAKSGVTRSDRVLVILPRVPQWWVAMLGLIRLGAVPIPGTPLLTPRDIAYRIEAGEVHAIVTD